MDAAANPCVAGVFQGQATAIIGAEIVRLPGAGKTDALVARILPRGRSMLRPYRSP